MAASAGVSVTRTRAVALKLLPAGMPADLVVRLPFMLLLGLALLCTWQAVFSLARTPGAFEIPLAAQRLARSGDYDAGVATTPAGSGGVLPALSSPRPPRP